MFLSNRLHMGLGVIPPFMPLLLPWLLFLTKRLLGKEESLEAKKLPFCAYVQSLQECRKSQLRQPWVLNNSVVLDLGNLVQLLLWVFQLVNALPEPEADLSAVGRWLLLSSELLTACWPQRRKGSTPHSLLSSTEL